MKRIVLAAALLFGLISPAFAQDFLSDLFGIIPTPLVQVQVSPGGYGWRRHRFPVARGGDPAIRELVTRVAEENGINPSLAHAVVRIESGYNCHAHNGAAAGIMQTNYRTARSMGVANPTSSCRAGLEAGLRYLHESIAMHGYGCAAFSAYQSGLGVHRCSAYGRRVMALMAGGADPGLSSGSGRHHRYAFHRHTLYASAHHRLRYRYASR